MKKISIFIIAAALIFGMAQCKKQETPTTPDAEYNWVHITMKVNGGEKYNIYPSTGAVVYTDNDKIYVSNGGKYRGVLTYSNGAFTGDLAYNDENPMSTTDHLHFYFLGGLTFDDPAPLTTASFDVSIANQSSKLPVLSYGMSRNLYTDGNATYSSTLENKCGLVKFTLSTGTDATVNVGGLYTKATIDFDNGVITPGAQGTITLHSGASNSNTERWAILLPQENISATATISGYTCSIEDSFDVANNDYNTTGVSISMTVPVPSIGIRRARYSDNSAPDNFISVSQATAKALADAEMTATGALGYICIYALEGSEYKWIANDGSTGQNSSIYDIVEGAPWDLVELWYEQGYDDFIWFTVE